MISGIYSAVCIRNAIKPRQISRPVSPGSRTMKEAGERCCCVRSNAVACNFRSLRAVKIFNDRGQKRREREREERYRRFCYRAWTSTGLWWKRIRDGMNLSLESLDYWTESNIRSGMLINFRRNSFANIFNYLANFNWM